jgi:hypothetical protein
VAVDAVSVQYIGGPTAPVQFGGVLLLLDATFDPPGEYRVGQRVLIKTQPPALEPDTLGAVDAVLLSHDQHPDNFDRLGREYAARAPLALSAASAARRLGAPVRTLGTWESTELPDSGGEPVRVTGVPAQHGPAGSEELVGEVTGFVLSRPGSPASTSAVATRRSKWSAASESASARSHARSCSPVPLAPRWPAARRSRSRASVPLRRSTYSAALPRWRCSSRAGPTSANVLTNSGLRSSGEGCPAACAPRSPASYCDSNVTAADDSWA